MATGSAHESGSAARPQDPEMIFDTAVPDELERYQRPPWQSSESATRVARQRQAAQRLGYLSLALGLGALLMPSRVARISGLEQHRSLLPLIGLRELTSGVGLLTAKKKAPWLWSRLVGDGMDLSVLLSSALGVRNPNRMNAAITTAVVAAVTAADVAASVRSSIGTDPAGTISAPDAYVASSIIVNKSAQECYQFWRNPGNLTRISPMLESVTVLDERTSRWVVRGTAGTRIEWHSRITADAPGDRIAWRSTEGGDLYHAGVVSFQKARGGRGTLVNATMHFKVPGGRAALSLAKVLGVDPRTEIREDLRRFKQFLEAGEIPTTRGQPSGRRSVFGRMTREGRLSRQGSPS
jgi:uncharacterized membrane protein